MFVEWLLILFHEARSYAVSVLRMLFKPSAYAKTVAIGDRNSFHHSMNFFIGSVSVLITICGILLLFGAGDVALKQFPGAPGASIRYVPDELLAFAKILFANLVMGLLCFFPIFVLTRRRSLKLVDFFHSWVHVTVAGFYIGLVTVLILVLFLPPVSDASYELITHSESPAVRKFCTIGRDHIACRISGGAMDFGTFVLNKSVDFKLVTRENVDVLPVLMMASIYLYIYMLPVMMIITTVWLFRVQGLLLSRMLNISMATSLCVPAYAATFMSLLVLAFPQLSPIFDDSDIATETRLFYKPDKQQR